MAAVNSCFLHTHSLSRLPHTPVILGLCGAGKSSSELSKMMMRLTACSFHLTDLKVARSWIKLDEANARTQLYEELELCTQVMNKVG